MTFWNRAKEELRKWIITLTGVACFAMLQTAVSEPLGAQVKDTECDCVAQRLNGLDSIFGNGSQQSVEFLERHVDICNITEKDELVACSEKNL